LAHARTRPTITAAGPKDRRRRRRRRRRQRAGESFLRVHRVAVPKAMRARRVNSMAERLIELTPRRPEFVGLRLVRVQPLPDVNVASPPQFQDARASPVRRAAAHAVAGGLAD
jgi:hypothetical protein